MKKSIKIMTIAMILLVLAAIPIYFVIRPQGAPEGYLQVRGNVSNPLNMTISELRNLPLTTIQANLKSSGHPEDNGVFNFTGVTLWSLLELSGISENATSVYVQASDSYGSTFSIQEIEQNNQYLIAYAKDGQPLESRDKGGTGPIRLVIGSDQYSQRWVKYVVNIEVS